MAINNPSIWRIRDSDEHMSSKMLYGKKNTTFVSLRVVHGGAFTAPEGRCYRPAKETIIDYVRVCDLSLQLMEDIVKTLGYTGKMSPHNGKKASNKKTNEKDTDPAVLNRKKVITPRFINREGNATQQNSSSKSGYKVPGKATPSSTSVTSDAIASPNTPTLSSTMKNTTNNTSQTLPIVSVSQTTASSTPSPTPSTIPAPLQPSQSNTTTSESLPKSPVTQSEPATTEAQTPPSTTSVVDQVVQVGAFQSNMRGQDGRLSVWVASKMLQPSGPCAKIIADSFRERVYLEGYCWSNISEANKEFYWDEFKKHCFWDEELNTKVRIAWESKASQTYSRYLYNMRSTKRNPNNKKPVHVSMEVWVDWKLKWNTEEFVRKSEQNKVNRRNGNADGPALATHTCGSASHLKIATVLKTSLGSEPSHSEFFLYTHTKNHDRETFISEKDRQIHAAYKEKREDLEAIGEDVDDDVIFYDVVGGHDRKRRLYGFGSYGKLIPSNKGSNEAPYHVATSADKELAQAKEELAQMKELNKIQKQQNDELMEITKAQAAENNAKCEKLEESLKQAMVFFDSLKEKNKD